MEYLIFTLPLIGAAIGWFTNYLAIKMLFHPRKPISLGVTEFQGVFPKRKPVLAERLGRIVARDLFSTEQIKAKLDSEETREQMREALITQLDDYIVNKFRPSNPMLGMLLNDNLIAQIKDRLGAQLGEAMPQFTAKIAEKIDEVDVETMVKDKVSNFSDQKLEDLLMSVIRKELRFVEVAGAILGFLIGCVQLLITMVADW